MKVIIRNKKVLILWIGIILLGLHHTTHAQTKLIFTDSINYVEIELDTSTSLVKLADTSNVAISNFIKGNTLLKRNSLLQNDSYYCVHIQVKNGTKQSDWILELDGNENKNVKYTYFLNGTLTFMTLGNQASFSSRFYKYKEPIAKLRFDSLKTANFFLILTGKEMQDVRVRFYSDALFTKKALNEYIFYGIFYGLLVLIAVFNFILFGYFRSMTYLWYAVYVIFSSLHTLRLNGIGFQYLWDRYPQLNSIEVPYFSFIAILFQLIYSISFLKLREQSLPIYNGIRFFLLSVFLILGIEYLFGKTFFPTVYLEFLSVCISICVGILTYNLGYKPARLFIISFCFHIVGLLGGIFEWQNFVHPLNLIRHSYEIGFALELFFLSLAFADQLRIERREKEIAKESTIIELSKNEELKLKIIKNLEEQELIKDKLKRELDLKVLEKTLQLKQANDLLRAQANEISLLNSKLDTENFSLKRKIGDIMKEIITIENVTYDEFKNFFPDEKSCYEYLQEIKWKVEFTCKKCSGSGFVVLPDSYSRRCLSCYYVESITSHTIFHKLKFPIVKAFHILYLVTNYPKITIDELATLVELRRNTCWNFKSKIQKRIELLNIKNLGNWEQIILEHVD